MKLSLVNLAPLKEDKRLWQRAKKLASSYGTHQLKTRLAQKYMDQEETAEPEGGPIASEIGD